MMQRMKKLHTPDSAVFDIYFQRDITNDVYLFISSIIKYWTAVRHNEADCGMWYLNVIRSTNEM